MQFRRTNPIDRETEGKVRKIYLLFFHICSIVLYNTIILDCGSECLKI